MPAHSGLGEIGRRRAAARVAGWVVCAAGVLAMVSGARVLRAGEEMTRQTRIELIRGLIKEVAVTKVVLPRGGRGVTVTPEGNIKGQTGATLAPEDVAIKAGLPVEITQLTFKSKEIVFELNGGEKNRKKWYQHLEVNGAPVARSTEPANTIVTYGAVIHLAFPDKLPNVTLLQVKQMISVVLDFERHSPTVLYSPAIPPKVKEAIKKHEVTVGMDRDAVLSSKGAPDRKVRELKEGVELEDWIYGAPPHVLMVTLDGDQVVAVHQY